MVVNASLMERVLPEVGKRAVIGPLCVVELLIEQGVIAAPEDSE